jgi:hypothetical protein
MIAAAVLVDKTPNDLDGDFERPRNIRKTVVGRIRRRWRQLHDLRWS